MTPEEAKNFLSTISQHQGRPGDTSSMHPDFAVRMATALQQARAEGLPLKLMSGFRGPNETGSAYDASGKSSHSYGLAADIAGLDGPNGTITQRWAQIAQQNGISNPYGVGNPREFNHWQLPSQPLETTPDLLGRLKTASATGNPQDMWNAYQAQSSPGALTTTPTFVMPANAPAGMRNNNPLNIKYFSGAERTYQGLVGPSQNTDQGDPQMVFKSPEDGWRAAYSLLGRKYANGKLTANDIIAGQGGWTPGNFQAAANVARSAGLRPDEDIRFNDPKRASAFMRGLVVQEQGAAAKAYSNEMIEAAISGKSIGTMTPSTGGTGGTTTPASTTTETPRGDTSAPVSRVPQTPEQAFSSSLGQAIASIGNTFGGGGGGSNPGANDPIDAPPIRMPGLNAAQAPLAPDARPAQYQGLGSQLASLSAQGQPTLADPEANPLLMGNITQGSTGMSGLLGVTGTPSTFNYTDMRSAQPIPNTLAGATRGVRFA